MTRERPRREERDSARELRPEVGRPPPSDLDAEAAVLSSIFLEPGVFEEQLVGVLFAEHFYSDANRRIYGAVTELYKAERSIDAVSVAGWLRDEERLQQIGGTPYLAQLADATPAVAHVLEHAERVIERWRRRKLIAEAQITAAKAYGDSDSTQKLLEAHSSAVTDLAYDTGAQRGLERLSASAIYNHSMEAARLARLGVALGVSTGLKRLDRLIGGMLPGDLYVCAGRPGMGKTQMGLHLAKSVGRDPRPRHTRSTSQEAHVQDVVAFFSLEMPTVQLGTRLLANVAGVDQLRLKRGHVRWDEHPRLADAAAEIGADLHVYVDDQPALKPSDIMARVRRLQRRLLREATELYEERVGLVIVDYLQIADADGNHQNREGEVASIAKGLKRAAKALQVPVWTFAQLNREVEKRPLKDRRPRLSDLRESGAIEQEADCIIFLYREDYYQPKDAEHPGIMECNIGKQRNGPLGTARVGFDASTGRLTDLADETEPVDTESFEHEYSEFDASQAGEDW